MDFTFQLFHQAWRGSPIEPVAKPFVMKFSDLEQARGAIPRLAANLHLSVHSVTITHSSGRERWFRLDGKWRRTKLTDMH